MKFKWIFLFRRHFLVVHGKTCNTRTEKYRNHNLSILRPTLRKTGLQLLRRALSSFFCWFFLASDVMLSLKRDTTLNLQVWNRHQTNLNTMKPLIKANRLCLLLKPQSTIVMVIFRLNTNRKEHFLTFRFSAGY